MTAEVLVSPLLSKETPVRNFNEDQLNPTCSAKPSMPDAEADTHYSGFSIVNRQRNSVFFLYDE
jgi:hypothetical protein